MNSTVAHMDQVVTDLGEVLSGLVAGDAALALTDADRLGVLRAAGDAFRRIEAVIVEAVASADAVEFPHRAGCRSMNELVQRTIRLDSAGAGRVVKAADAVRRDTELTTGAPLPARWPQLRAALLDGVIGIAGLLAATGPIDAARGRIGAAERLCVDEILADHARGCAPATSRDDSVAADDVDAGGADADGADADGADAGTGTDSDAGDGWQPPATPDDLRVLSQDLAVVLDPDGAEPSDRNAADGRFLSFGRLKDGRYPIRGALLPEVFAQLQLLMDAQLNPKTDGPPVPSGVVFTESDPDAGLNGGEGEDPFNSDPRNVIDSRTRAQKQHDVLAAILGIAARHNDTPTLGGAAPTLVVQVNATDLVPEQDGVHDGSGCCTDDAGASAADSRHCTGLRCCCVALRRRLRSCRCRAVRPELVPAGARVGTDPWDRGARVAGRRTAGRLQRCDPARPHGRGPHRRDHGHRPNLHRPSATSDRAPRQGVPDPRVSCPRGLVRDPPCRRARARRTHQHLQRRAAVLVAPPQPRVLRVGDPHAERPA